MRHVINTRSPPPTRPAPNHTIVIAFELYSTLTVLYLHPPQSQQWQSRRIRSPSSISSSAIPEHVSPPSLPVAFEMGLALTTRVHRGHREGQGKHAVQKDIRGRRGLCVLSFTSPRALITLFRNDSAKTLVRSSPQSHFKAGTKEVTSKVV